MLIVRSVTISPVVLVKVAAHPTATCLRETLRNARRLSGTNVRKRAVSEKAIDAGAARDAGVLPAA